GSLQGRRELVDRRGEVVRLGREGSSRDVEVRDQALQRFLVRGELREHVSGRGDEVREIVRVLAQQRLVDDRGGPAGLPAVAEGLVERLGRRLALDGGILRRVLLRGGHVRE